MGKILNKGVGAQPAEYVWKIITWIEVRLLMQYTGSVVNESILMSRRRRMEQRWENWHSKQTDVAVDFSDGQSLLKQSDSYRQDAKTFYGMTVLSGRTKQLVMQT